MEVYLFTFFGKFIGSIVGGATGLGGMMISLPILSLGMPASTAVLVSCISGAVSCTQLAWLYRRYVVWDDMKLLWLSCIPGCIFGAFTLKVVSVSLLQIMISLMIVCFILLQLFSRHAQWKLGDTVGWTLAAGFTGGFAHSSVSVVGVPMGVFVLLKRWDRDRARATLCMFFVFSGWMTLVSQWMAGLYEFDLLKLAAVGLAGSLIGQPLGFWIGRHLNQKIFVRFVLLFLSCAAIVLFYKGIQ